ncbi:hypothetical protein [Acinetobacter sp. ANC 4641]|uniref:hypothetical protein n=1 Tax=Acinetobacter sp. ANC 4641 TaxID=2529847 RepID=UPI00103B4E6C|nr:hypothetical protein [Acinetobacter sp. ANC 4641]TCB11573.1 hypothetical protein E0H78_08075 [Acinetobacter sp. ANC 4641]
MENSQGKSTPKVWRGVIIAVVLGMTFLGFLYYSVASDNNDINRYSKQWRSTGDESSASAQHDMSNMKDMDMSKMSEHDMANMQHDAPASSAKQP